MTRRPWAAAAAFGAVRDVFGGIAAIGVKELRGRMRGRRAFVILTIYLLLLAGFAWMVETLMERTFTGGFGVGASPRRRRSGRRSSSRC